MIVDKCSDEWKAAKAPSATPQSGPQAAVRIPKTSGVNARSDGLVPMRIPKASKVSSSIGVTARANTSSAVDEAREAKIEQTKLDNIAMQRQVEGRRLAWKKWKQSGLGLQARTGPTRATLIAIAVQSMSTPNEVAKRLGEGEVVRI